MVDDSAYVRPVRCIFRAEGSTPDRWSEERERVPDLGDRIEHYGESYVVTSNAAAPIRGVRTVAVILLARRINVDGTVE
jgi:hypothetical protein